MSETKIIGKPDSKEAVALALLERIQHHELADKKEVDRSERATLTLFDQCLRVANGKTPAQARFELDEITKKIDEKYQEQDS